MRAYLAELNAEVALIEADFAESMSADVQLVRNRLSPLEDRLARLLTTIPIEIQRDGLALTVLQGALRGRWRGNCHPGELGSALRKLGYIRKRCWKSEGGFSALWYAS